MLWVKAFHIIFMVAWFSGLFYLPRLFVYHSKWNDALSHEHFNIMEKRLYYYITTPAAILTILFGFWVMRYHFSAYLHQPWMHMKLTLVFLLIIYHIYLGKIVGDFQQNKNRHHTLFFRWFNELPTLLLVAIVLLVVLKPT